jgi:hypothetical protein
VKNGVLPFIKGGHRTIFFKPSEVERALKKRTVKEVGWISTSPTGKHIGK